MPRIWIVDIMHLFVNLIALSYGFVTFGISSEFSKNEAKDDSSRVSVETIIESHERIQQLIHQFDVEIEVWHKSLYGSATGKGETRNCIWRWSRNGQEERIRDKSFLEVPNDDPSESEHRLVFEDLYQNGNSRKILRGYNPDAPPKITPIAQHSVKAYVEPRTNLLPGYMPDPALMLLIKFRSARDFTDPQKGLRELANTSKNIELLPSSSDADGLIGIRFLRADTEKNTDRASTFDVYLDPSMHLMVKKVIEHYPNYLWYDENGKTARVNVRWVREVTKAKNDDSGVAFPLQTELRIYRDDREEPTAIFRAVVNRLLLNEPLPGDALNFAFPEHMLVQFPVINGKNPVKLWGPNNEPVEDIHSISDLGKYAGVSIEEDQPKVTATRAILIALNAALAIGIGFLLVRRYFRTARDM